MADSAASEPPRDAEDGGSAPQAVDGAEVSVEKSVEAEKSTSRPGSVAPSVRGQDDKPGDSILGDQVLLHAIICWSMHFFS